MGVADEKQGLCSGTENYWAVNKEASKKDQDATLEFLNWVVTSDAGLNALANDMGYVAPFKKAIKTNNVLYTYIDKANEEGKTNINWLFTYTPNTEVWRNGVVDGLALYSLSQSNENWANVRSKMVDGWEEQYRLSHQK